MLIAVQTIALGPRAVCRFKQTTQVNSTKLYENEFPLERIPVTLKFMFGVLSVTIFLELKILTKSLVSSLSWSNGSKH